MFHKPLKIIINIELSSLPCDLSILNSLLYGIWSWLSLFPGNIRIFVQDWFHILVEHTTAHHSTPAKLSMFEQQNKVKLGQAAQTVLSVRKTLRNTQICNKLETDQMQNIGKRYRLVFQCFLSYCFNITTGSEKTNNSNQSSPTSSSSRGPQVYYRSCTLYSVLCTLG